MLIVAGASLTVVDYSISQEYSNVATDQFEDNTEAYHTIQTQQSVGRIKTVIVFFVIIFFVIILTRLWLPKKLIRKADKKIQKMY